MAGGGSSSSNINNRKPEVPASKSQIVMPLPVPSSSYKNQPQFSQPTTSSSQRQQSSSTSSSRPAYPTTSESNSSSQKTDERLMHRHQQESSSSSSSTYPSMSRSIDPMKQQGRMSSSSSQQQQQQQLSHQHIKSSSNIDQRHPMGSKTAVDYQLQNKKPSSNIDYQTNRSSSSSSSLAPPIHSSHQQQQQQNLLKKPSWPSQQQQQQPPLQQNKPQTSSSHQQNLSASQSSNNIHRANPTQQQQQHLPPSYNDQQSNKSQPMMSNDFWFSDNTQQTQQQQNMKSMNTIKQEVIKKSIFSPSPNHEPTGADKMMMLSTTNIKRESPKSEKSDRKSSTPSKKDKRSLDGKTSSQDKNKHLSGLPSSLLDTTKKRPYNTADNDNHENRDSKVRKIDMKPMLDIPLGKSQSIETNPDFVKSLLAETFTTHNKFDSNGDSPDVSTPENHGNIPPSPLISATLPNQLLQQKQSLIDHQISIKNELLLDNGNLDDSSSGHKKHSKSKKKKDKHKKKKKSHKSDREDSEREAAPLKLILAKDKSDSKSSPESQQTTGSLKIKIPINKTDLVVNAAPLKLKISKDKIFNNSFGDGGVGGVGTSSSSSSSHKKKDKDKDKHRKSKHNNNNSDGYPMSLHQQQQYQIGKVSLKFD